jgi:hypothetical protein
MKEAAEKTPEALAGANGGRADQSTKTFSEQELNPDTGGWQAVVLDGFELRVIACGMTPERARALAAALGHRDPQIVYRARAPRWRAERSAQRVADF